MALPSKTIELIEQIAENLDIWAKGWGISYLLWLTTSVIFSGGWHCQRELRSGR